MKQTAIQIISETPDYVVISKPAGLDCQNSKPGRPSVVEWMEKRFRFRGLVHRLDFHTSGVMICAKNANAAKKLTDQIQSGAIERTYRAVAMGTGLASEGRIDLPIDGADAATKYRVLETFANATYLELTLETGRKHQIRRHLFELGHPIVGDHLYKKKGSDKLLDRPALHSFQMRFEGKVFEAPLSADITALLQRFRKIQADFNP